MNEYEPYKRSISNEYNMISNIYIHVDSEEFIEVDDFSSLHFILNSLEK